jgi:hypothetical protein
MTLWEKIREQEDKVTRWAYGVDEIFPDHVLEDFQLPTKLHDLEPMTVAEFLDML